MVHALERQVLELTQALQTAADGAALEGRAPTQAGSPEELARLKRTVVQQNKKLRELLRQKTDATLRSMVLAEDRAAVSAAGPRCRCPLHGTACAAARGGGPPAAGCADIPTGGGSHGRQEGGRRPR